jgi:HK97 family phage prohead protease
MAAPNKRIDPPRGAEWRSLPFAECRLAVREAGKAPKIVGYPIKFNSLSSPIPIGQSSFREIVHPDAIAKAMKRQPDVRALIDHMPTHVLGRTRSGTLRLVPDEYGLRCEIDPPDTTFAKDTLESLRRGDVDGMSFGFETRADSWSDQLIDGKRTSVRTLGDIDLYDVSVVTYPAYPDTEVAVRSLSAWHQTRGPEASAIWDERRRLLDAMARRSTRRHFVMTELDKR